MTDAGQPLRIGIDGRYQGQSLTGVPRYIDELCKQLDTLLPEARFFVYAAKGDGIRLPSERWELRLEPRQQLTRLKPNIWWKLFAGRLIRKDKLDVFWACAGFIPGGLKGVRVVFTVYDLTFKLFPETMSRTHVWAYRIFFARDVRRADQLITISQGTSDRLYSYFGRRADAVIRPDAGPQFCPQSAEHVVEMKTKYKLASPFILAVSTLEPRKNLLGLIDSFLQLKRQHEIQDYELVLIGKKGWRSAELDNKLASKEAGSIRWLGYVPDSDLPALYSGCELFCMPSLYEGFGLPVLEARRCGTRVVATESPELQEAGDGLCTYVRPNPESISAGILTSLSQTKQSRVLTISTFWRSQAESLQKIIALNIKTI